MRLAVFALGTIALILFLNLTACTIHVGRDEPVQRQPSMSYNDHTSPVLHHSIIVATPAK